MIPADFTWRQSTVADYLACGRRVYLQHVLGVQPDYALDCYAALVGSGAHAGLACGLRALAAGQEPTRQQLTDACADAFDVTLTEEQERGATTDPERAQVALDRLLGEQLDLIAQLLADPRLRAIEWRGVEQAWTHAEPGPQGRRFSGTIDAWGVALSYVPAFGQAGRGEPGRGEPVALQPGDRVLVDWKTGSEGPPLDWVARALNLQLGVYQQALRLGGQGPVRAFLGVLRDVERPKRPKDPATGEVIASKLREPNPAWCAAAGVDPADLAAVEACAKRPRNVGPKWLERDNPAYLAACSRPRGPVFHECVVDQAVIGQTVADAIDAARLGLFPASGAINGECARCPWRSRCAHQEGAAE